MQHVHAVRRGRDEVRPHRPLVDERLDYCRIGETIFLCLEHCFFSTHYDNELPKQRQPTAQPRPAVQAARDVKRGFLGQGSLQLWRETKSPD
jgi:hypothetical protein